MTERRILIADKDSEERQIMAEFFTTAGYQVRTTGSAADVLCSILDKEAPVLLLGSDFDKKIEPANLIHLLKKCNRHLTIILVSDETPLHQERRIRQEGIFYHALKPNGEKDTEEIRLAVECAFNALGKLLEPGRKENPKGANQELQPKGKRRTLCRQK